MHRTSKVLLLATVAAAVCWASVSEASFFGLPRALKYQLARIGFDNPVLPPIGHSRFCLRYPEDCKVHGIDFRRHNITLTPERWSELNNVNQQVNRDIVAEVTPGNGLTENRPTRRMLATAKTMQSPNGMSFLRVVGHRGRCCFQKSWCRRESITSFWWYAPRMRIGAR